MLVLTLIQFYLQQSIKFSLNVLYKTLSSQDIMYSFWGNKLNIDCEMYANGLICEQLIEEKCKLK